MTLDCSFLFEIVFFQYLCQHLTISNQNIPKINIFLTLKKIQYESLQNPTGVADDYSGWGSGKSSWSTPIKCLGTWEYTLY